MGRGPIWTAAEEQRLVAMMTAGIAPNEIAVRINRTAMAVHSRCVLLRSRGYRVPYARIGASTKARRRADAPVVTAPRKTRPCLGGCGRPVVRDGIQFLCPHCRTRSAGPFDVPAVVRYR